jgi:UDP-2,3-diacylglucosamine pyrophosphatase LpxH
MNWLRKESRNTGRAMSVRAITLIMGLLLALMVRDSPAGEPQTLQDSARLAMAFVSDTQKPFWYESLTLGSNRNEEATDSIFADLIRRRPQHLFILGDLVSFGPYRRTWEGITQHVENLRKAGVAVHAVLGNHELMLFPQTGEENLQELFPDHVRTGYVQTVDSVAVVLLNSNFSDLGTKAVARQEKWYARALDSLQTEPAILHIVVCCHHSPFSNSKIVGGSKQVQKEFVPGFLATAKCRLFLSGHAHTYEQFRQGGKTFLVIGGGGGARHPLNEGPDRRWDDLAPTPKPLFHYLEIRRDHRKLIATVRGLRDDFGGFRDYSTVTIQEGNSEPNQTR